MPVFTFYAPLWIAAVAFVFGIRSFADGWIAFTIVLFALGTNFFPAFQYHYLAAIVCLFVLVSARGLERLSCWPRDPGAIVCSSG